MQYKTTALCTISLLTGIGLMLVKDNIQQRQRSSHYQSTKELLKQSNSILFVYNDKVIYSAKESIKKKKVYKKLLPPMERIKKLTDDFISALEKREAKLYKSPKFEIRTRVELFNKTYYAINEDIEDLRRSILLILDRLKENRNLGIRPAALKQLEEKYFINIMEGISFDVLGSIYSPQLTSLEFEKLKNKILVIQGGFVNYLASKIGGTVVCSPSRFMVMEFPNKAVVNPGETFESSFHMALIDSRIEPVSVKVDGVPIKKEDYLFTYRTKPTVSGEHQYTVEMGLENPFTGKIDTYKRSFSYYVK